MGSLEVSLFTSMDHYVYLFPVGTARTFHLLTVSVFIGLTSLIVVKFTKFAKIALDLVGLLASPNYCRGCFSSLGVSHWFFSMFASYQFGLLFEFCWAGLVVFVLWLLMVLNSVPFCPCPSF